MRRYHRAEKGSIPGHWAIRRSLAVVLVSCAALYAAQVCEFQLNNCPESYNGDTIVLPDEVIALSSNVHACRTAVSFQDPSNTTRVPSIVFVIDHSGSMTGANSSSGANDRWGSRYTVTRALLDTIYKSQPSAEIGIVVFREHLFFDPTTSDYFSKYFQRMPRTYDSEPNQAYLPLMRLNGTYDGRNGIDIIKDVLETDTATISSSGYRYVDLTYRPGFSTSGSTNINIGFEAAKQAFTTATNPPAQQFVIFLSDGEPRGTDQAGMAIDYFTRGVNVPTTFTVYFTSSTTAPQSLQTMTRNIRENGYSPTNPRSDLWTIQTTYDDLMRLFMEQIIANILIPGNPTRMVVNNTRTSTTYIDSNFVFGSAFPLKDSLTRFTVGVTYRYADQNDRVVDDSTVVTTFHVLRRADAPVPPTVSVRCETVVGDSIPVTAALLDTSGDGHLDRIDLTWTDTAGIRQSMPSIAELIGRLQITTLDGKRVDLHAATIVPDLANDRISIILAENTGPILETGWQSAQVQLTNVPMSNDGRRFAVTRIVDGAGPVIKEAIYYKDETTGKDSLVVVFSEPVTWASGGSAPSGVFNYFRRDTSRTDAFSGIPASDLLGQNRGAIVTMSNGFEPIGSIDSLQLRGLIDRVTDAAGNRPPADGRKAPVVYGGEPLTVGVINNPFVPGETPLPAVVLKFYQNVVSRQASTSATTGTIVGVQSRRPLDGRPDGSFGTARIYDAVANVVRDDLKLFQASGATDYGVYWDGKNHNGRLVGAGAYLMVVQTKDIDGNKESLRVKVGVQRHR